MEKIKNRIFASFFFVIILLWVIWNPIMDEINGDDYSNIPGYPYILWLSPFNVALLIVVVGLLYEIFRPTLSFDFQKNRKWVSVGIFLLVIAVTIIVVEIFWKPYDPEYSVLGSRTFEYPIGSGYTHTWPNLLWEFLSIFCMETVSFNLLFGFLFMTKSIPQASKSYNIMLIGVIAFDLFVFLFLYLTFFITGKGFSTYSGLTRMELLTQYWFHWDLWSEIVRSASAIWLLWKGRYTKSILIAFLYGILSSILSIFLI